MKRKSSDALDKPSPEEVEAAFVLVAKTHASFFAEAPVEETKRTFNTREAAAYLGIGKTKLFQLKKAKKINAALNGSKALYLRAELDRYLNTLSKAK